jgi:diguanylate cyclase (GGDEF)-like protein
VSTIDTSHTPTLESFLLDPDHLPSPSASVLAVIRKVEEPEATVLDVARLIEKDVALAVQLLRVANSALYAPRSPIMTVERAVSTLGLRSVRMLALAASMRSLVPDATETVDMDEIRRRMLINGSLARKFAAAVSPLHEEEAFLAGLLTGLGPVAMAVKDPELCRRVLDITGVWPNIAEEKSLLGFTSNDITTYLVNRWEMPATLCEAIERRVQETDSSDSPLTRILRLSLLAENVLCGSHRGAALARLLEATRSELDMTVAETEAWLIEAEPLVEEAADAFALSVPPSEAYATLLFEATSRMQALALETNSAAIEGNRTIAELSAKNEELRTEATTDFLTQLPNRALFEEMFDARVGSSRSPMLSGRTVGLILIDLDLFKSVNDTYGHVAGDAVLRAMGALLQRQTRGNDLPARYGGEEFVVLLDQTNHSELKLVSERLRKAIEAEQIVLDDGTELSITASIGGALLDEVADDSRAALLERADKRLYVSKQHGRNRCTID